MRMLPRPARLRGSERRRKRLRAQNHPRRGEQMTAESCHGA